MSSDYLNHFTSLPVVIDVLVKKRLVLSDPREWEDRNDAYYLRQYKQREELKTLLVVLLFYAQGDPPSLEGIR